MSRHPPLPGGDLTVADTGSAVGTRPRINFLDGTGIQVDVADDSANNEVDVTITATSSGVTLAASTLAGRGSAAGSGTAVEITLGTNLTMAGTTLNASAASGAATTEPFVTIGNTAGLGNERALTGSGRVSVTDDGANTTVTLDIPNNGVGNAQLRQGGARTVVGVTGNATANVADIAGGGAGTYLRDSGSALTFSGIKEIIENLALQGDLSPAQIVAATNDYDPTNLSLAGLLRLSTDASRAITGLAGGADGRILGILNVGAFDIVLTNQSASSLAGNRFLFGADCTLAAEHACILVYDSTSSRWRMLARAFPFTAAAAATTLTAGAGLTGGGDLSANRTFTVGANADGSITVNADDVQVGILATDAQHGARGGGTQHANAVAAGAAGFMSGADKTALDAAVPNTRSVIAGAGMTGGGALSGDVTLNVIANADGTLTVNANDIQVATNGVGNAQFRQGAALSVVGVTGNATANVADIAAANDHDVLRRKGTAVGFGRMLPKEVALTDGANIAVDASLVGQGDALTVTLAGNRTMDAPTNETAGQWITFIVRQDATGSRTITWAGGAGGYRFTTTVTSPTLTTTANKFDSVLFRYNATDDKWDCHAVNLSA